MKNIPMASPYVGEDEAKAVYDVIMSGWISMGAKVTEFEERFAEYVDAKYAVSTNSGTAALHLALIAAGIKEGDEVLVPDITFASSAKVVMYERAVPILVEVDPRTYNISIEDAKKKVTGKTKAIIPVDMNGMPVDYDEILFFATEYKLKVIADSAESLGAVYKGKKVGSLVPMHIFSFFPNKNITTGEGGMVTTNDEKLAKLLGQLRNMGQDYRYHHIHLGYNYRMTEIAATIGLKQLDKLDFIMSDKSRIIEKYNHGFAGHPNISTPYIPEYVTNHAWYMYTITLADKIDRDTVKEKLKKVGIDTRVSFPPIHKQPFFQDRYNVNANDCVVSYAAWKKLLNLPIWVGLPEDLQDYVIDNVKTIVG
jgi:perosamine synthetase